MTVHEWNTGPLTSCLPSVLLTCLKTPTVYWPAGRSVAQRAGVDTSGSGPYKPLTDIAAEFYGSVKGMESDPQVIVDVIMKALNARHPKARYAAPFNIKVLLFLRRMLSDRVYDKIWNKVQGIPKSV